MNTHVSLVLYMHTDSIYLVARSADRLQSSHSPSLKAHTHTPRSKWDVMNVSAHRDIFSEDTNPACCHTTDFKLLPGR